MNWIDRMVISRNTFLLSHGYEFLVYFYIFIILITLFRFQHKDMFLVPFIFKSKMLKAEENSKDWEKTLTLECALYVGPQRHINWPLTLQQALGSARGQRSWCDSILPSGIQSPGREITRGHDEGQVGWCGCTRGEGLNSAWVGME